jgi:hypothetical protein
MDENPYKSPESSGSEPAKVRPKSRVGFLVVASLAGAVAGLVLLGPFIHVPRTPADPFGDEAYWHGASYGGLIELTIAVYRLAILRRDS